MSGSPDYTLTPNLGLFKPNYDMDDGQWGNHLNSNADVLDSALSTGSGGMFLPLVGGVMAGPLSLAGNATQPLHAVPLQQLTALIGGPVTPVGGVRAPLPSLLSVMSVPADSRVAFVGDSITIAANVMNAVSVLAAGGTAPYTFSVAGLPASLTVTTFTPSCVFGPNALTPNGGVPSTPITITATDNLGATGARSYTIALAPQSYAFTLVPTGASSGVLTQTVDTVTQNVNNRGAQFWIPFLTGQQLNSAPELNFGKSGDTTALVLARISDAVNAACGAYVVMIGVNDLNEGGSPSLASIQANLTAIWNALLATGRPVVACPILPRTLVTPANDGSRAMLWALNRWIRSKMGTIPGLYVVDSAPDYGDPLSPTATPIVGPLPDYTYSYDGLHPKGIGAFHAFRKTAETLSTIYRSVDLSIAGVSDSYTVGNPQGNLLANGMMTYAGATGSLSGRCTGVAPDGWILGSSDAGASPATFTGIGAASAFSDGVTPAAQVTISGTAGGGWATTVLFSQTIPNLGHIVAGDRLQLSVRVEMDGASLHLTSPYCQLYYRDSDGITHYLGAGPQGPVTPIVSDASPAEAYVGTLLTPLSPPLVGTPTGGYVLIGVYITNSGSAPVSGTLKIGAAALRKVV